MKVKDGESTQPFSFPSDVWSLGVTLVDFLLSKQFHKQLGKAAIYEKFKKTMTTNTVELHYPEFWDLVLELLAWDSEVRPTAMEVAQRLMDQEEARPEEVSRRASTSGESSAKREKLQI
jgi:serine/threonine protein kinase